jgi:hypothetical protein
VAHRRDCAGSAEGRRAGRAWLRKRFADCDVTLSNGRVHRDQTDGDGGTHRHRGNRREGAITRVTARLSIGGQLVEPVPAEYVPS